MVKLKVVGNWVGVVEVDLEQWTVSMLRAEVARRSNANPESINLISAGRVLKDGDGTEKLSRLGIKNNSKVLSIRINIDKKKELLSEDERSSRFHRIKAAAAAFSQRHAGRPLPWEDFNIELEDRSGKKIKLGSETDHRAVIMGLMLHTKGKYLIQKQKYKDALEVLEMGEEALSLCNPQIIEDISSIYMVGELLQKARERIEKVHGKGYSTVRLCRGGLHSEIVLHLRLELLEGVIAYHTGQFEDSRKALISAHSKVLQIQVLEEALTDVMSMGFKESDAKRALRINNQDVGVAVDFLVQERGKREKKEEEDRRRQHEIREQKSYGVTPMKKSVDLERLNELVSTGYEKVLAAEALRRNENDTPKALDDLTVPDINAMMQQDIESRKRKREGEAEIEAAEQLLALGIERSGVGEAVGTGRTVEKARETLSQTTLDSSNDGNAATNSAQLTATDNILSPISSSDYDLGVPNEDLLKGGGRDVDMEDDYDINVAKEYEAIEEYLVLLDSNSSTSTCSE